QGPAFAGIDFFAYKINDGLQDSLPATVTLSAANEPIFSDNFSRGSDPGPLSPWVLRAGVWTVTGGKLLSGTNTSQTYATVYLAKAWSDFPVQARRQFPAGAFGGGVGGRLNPISGAHYAAWIYPEGSLGGSNVFKLIKFQDWQNWTLFTQIPLATVG